MSLKYSLAGGLALAVMAGLGSVTVPAFAETAAVTDPLDVRSAVATLTQSARAKGRIRVIVGLDQAMPMDEVPDADQALAGRKLRAVQDAVVARSLKGLPADRITRFEMVPYLSVFVGPEDLARLAADPAVVSMVEDVPVAPALAKSTQVIKADKLWDKGIDGAGFTVAVLDTGVQSDHPMLAGKTVSEACYSTNSGTKIKSLCKGGVTESTKPGSGQNCSPRIDGCEHGTHVASIAVGNGSALDGVARSSRLIAMQVFTKFLDAATCGGTAPCVLTYTTDQIKALERVYKIRKDHKIAAVNMSLGGSSATAPCDTDPRTAIIRKLRGARIATVIASGNNGWTGSVSLPSCISEAVAVGSTTKDDKVSSFSNHAALVKLLAPGSDIKAAVPLNKYDKLSGTSMATPHVAGAFALMRDVKADATVDDILAALVCTGKTVKRGTLGKPRINLQAARNYLKNPPGTTRTWTFASSAEDWEPILGRWGVIAGFYAVTGFNTAGNWNASWVPDCQENLTVTAGTLRVDDDSGMHWNSGIMLKADVDETTKAVSGYWFAYNKSAASDPSDPQGQAVIWRLDNYSLSNNTGSSSLLCTKDEAGVNIGGHNLIKVVSKGASHSFYLNGRLVCQVTDGTYATGSIGLAVAAPLDNTVLKTWEVDSVSIGPASDARPDAVSLFHPAQVSVKAVPKGASPAGVRN